MEKSTLSNILIKNLSIELENLFHEASKNLRKMNNDLPKQVSIIERVIAMSLVPIAEFVDIKIWDTDKKKRELINSKKLTIEDKDSNSITENLKNWNITASENLNDALTGSDLVMICIPMILVKASMYRCFWNDKID